MSRVVVCIVVFMGLAAGCFDPQYQEGVACSEALTCPPGMMCGEDGRCWRVPPPDASVPPPDAEPVGTCDDGEQNGNETGVDCGGRCGPCPDGSGCADGSDCQSGVCADDRCAEPLCGDGVVNQESEECDDGNLDDTDWCTSMCLLASCGDGIQNGDEQDVDCGGHCGAPSCWTGQVCTGDEDCYSGDCAQGRCRVQGALVTGAWHTCALLETGAVRCWGYNVHGQLGYGHTQQVGDNEYPSSAGDVDVGGQVIQLAAGYFHTCGLLETGAVRCWGYNNHGQLGYGHTQQIGDNEHPSSAGDVQVGGQVVQLAAGGYHTCGLLETGAVRCWGRNSEGQLGYGHTQQIGDNEHPSSAGDVDVGGQVVQLAAGAVHTCALLATGAVRCWGYNVSGQLGYGHTQQIGDDEHPSSAGDVQVGGQVVQLALGTHHTCGLLETGGVRCWGYNVYGQLGYGHTQPIGGSELPSSVGDVDVGGSVTQVTTVIHHTCARLDTGGVRCWGRNSEGQLGYGHTQQIGDNEHPSSAGDVDVGGSVYELAIGLGYHTCARLGAGAVRCWGHNVYGQLGYGHTQNIGDDEHPSSAGDVPYR